MTPNQNSVRDSLLIKQVREGKALIYGWDKSNLQNPLWTAKVNAGLIVPLEIDGDTIYVHSGSTGPDTLLSGMVVGGEIGRTYVNKNGDTVELDYIWAELPKEMNTSVKLTEAKPYFTPRPFKPVYHTEEAVVKLDWETKAEAACHITFPVAVVFWVIAFYLKTVLVFRR